MNNVMMRFLYLYVCVLSIIPQLSFASTVEYGINIKNSNPEFGKKIPKELCLDGKRSPCRLPVFKIYNTVPKVIDTKNKLSRSGYAALKRNSRAAQVVWEFNLCKPMWDKKKPCVEAPGYLVVKNYKVVFYVFQK